MTKMLTFVAFVLFGFLSYSSAFLKNNMPIFHKSWVRIDSKMSSNDESNFIDSNEEDPMNNPSIQESIRALQESKGIIPIGPELKPDDNTAIDNKILSSVSSEEAIKYYRLVSSLTPNDLLMKFAKTAPLNVQEAAKTTIMNLLGSIPNYAVNAVLVTTSSKLASLFYQMQITGYMFKNAEYRMSLTRSLKGLPKLPPPAAITTQEGKVNPIGSGTKISGEVTLQTPQGELVKVDVQDLTKALSNEVNALRKELALLKSQRESELKTNLLTYIQALPEKELQTLTSDMSPEILQAIQMLVNAMMEKVGIDTTAGELVVQQSMGQLAQLCVWQMVVGYKLRELEAMDKGVPMD